MLNSSMSKYSGLTKGDDRALKALGVDRPPPGSRPTKALRFTLPNELVEKLEAMSKPERDAWAIKALSDEIEI